MRYLLLVVLALLGSGCAKKPPSDTLLLHNDLQASVAVADRKKSYAALYPGALEPFARNAVRVRNPHQVGSDLLTPVNARWEGPLVDLVKAAARKAGYRVRAQGDRSGARITVTVDWQHIPLIEVLREAFGQAKGLARLEIDQSERTMTVVFVRPERTPVPHLDDTQL